MSLLVWMPLNGNLTNQGLSNVSFTANTASYSTVTKFAKSLVLKTANTVFSVPELNGARVFSIAFWIYSESNSSYTRDWNSAIFLGAGSSNLRFESTYSSSARALSYHNNTDCKITSASRILAQDKDKWYHVAFVCDGTKIYSYTDGVNKYTDTANGGSLNGNVYLSHGTYYGYMNDLRIYDHALSNKEVEELSKGLCCHYPLNDACNTASVNKYSGATFDGKPASASDGFVVTKLTDERGYNIKLNYTGTGTNAWMCIQYPVASFTAGKTYDWSCKIRVHKTTTGLAFRTARMGNDWEQERVNVTSKVNENWTEYHGTLKLEATSTRSGTSYTTAPLVEFYTANLSTKGTVYTIDFDIKDVQFAECDVDAPATDGAFATKTVYDTSGFGNTGTITNSPTISNGSPRYDACTSFPYKNYISGKSPFGARNVSEFTISMWVSLIQSGGYATLFQSNGMGGSGVWLAMNVEGNAQWMYRNISPNYVKGGTVVTANTWNLYTLTYKDGVATWYLNGQKNISGTYTDKTIPFATTFILADSYSGTTWNTNFNGKLSDFRIYAKALSDSQVLELYNAPVSISNNGTLITKGEFVE